MGSCSGVLMLGLVTGITLLACGASGGDDAAQGSSAQVGAANDAGGTASDAMKKMAEMLEGTKYVPPTEEEAAKAAEIALAAAKPHMVELLSGRPNDAPEPETGAYAVVSQDPNGPAVRGIMYARNWSWDAGTDPNTKAEAGFGYVRSLSGEQFFYGERRTVKYTPGKPLGETVRRNAVYYSVTPAP
jgi:hypothetical protein